MGYFKDEHPDTFKARLAPYIGSALMSKVPPGGIHKDALEGWFEKLWVLACGAHYDLGWSFPRIRDCLPSWLNLVVEGKDVALDDANKRPQGVMETIWVPGQNGSDRGGLTFG